MYSFRLRGMNKLSECYSLLKKGLLFKERICFQKGSKLVYCRVDSSSEGGLQKSKQEVTKVVSLIKNLLGPVVQSFVSLTSLLRVISLTVLGDSIYIILIFFAEKM